MATTRKKTTKKAATKKTGKKATAKTTRRSKAQSARKFRKTKIALGVMTLLLFLLGAYSLYLAKTVRVKFDGKRWAAPAQIYARPLELYAGADVSSAQLKAELRFLGYREVAQVTRPAEWSQKGGRFTIHTRDFQFWDGAEPSQTVVVRANATGIQGIAAADGSKPVDLMRLEPALVGSIYPAHNEDRVLVKREDLPDSLVNGLLAVEDHRFFSHHGVDLRGIVRALVANLRAGRTVQGGSTLTQQLVKNFVLTSDRTIWRKINEALMALIVEARYDKDEILEAYANEIFLGQEGDRAIHGFGLAAYFYFDRPLRELRLHETALLVGLVRGASYYNPRRNPERALARRNLVIDQMLAAGMIEQDEADAARAQPLGISSRGELTGHRVPAFVDLVRRQLQRDYREEDLTSEGLRIFSTLDPWVQQRSGEALGSRLAKLERSRKLDKGTLQGAVVVVSAQNGEVQALVGGREVGYAGFNRALDAIRPIGSLVKPAVYLTALSEPKRFTLTSLIDDKPIDLKLPNGDRWTPRNYDNQVHGRVSLHEALARSLNLATVNLGMQIGLQPVIQTLHNLGVARDIDAFPSLLLGALSLSPLEVAQVYQSLAAGGFRSPLRAIRAVIDAGGEQLQHYPLTVRAAADPAAVFLLDRNLVEVVDSGTAAGLKRMLPAGLQVAGKTGTTNDLRDSWFAGFSADRVSVVWVGRDDNQPTGFTGASGALPIWGELMRGVSNVSLQLTPPSGIEYHWIDQQGRLAERDCEGVVAFPYIAGSQPTERSDCAREQQGLGGFFRKLFD